MGSPLAKGPRLPLACTAGTGEVAGLARALYDGRCFTGLSLLADALEKAGCTDMVVLAHARGAGPHVRGCWLLDLVLGLR